MDIKNGTILGYWITNTGRRQVIAFTFPNDPTLHVVTPYGNGIAVRSRNFVKLDAHNFEPVADFKEADVLKFPESQPGDTGGFKVPVGFALPKGYAEVTESDGSVYLVPAELVKDDNTIVTTTGTTALTTTRSTILTDPIGWVKANPILAAGIALGVYLLFFQKKGKKKRGSFSLF